MVNRTSIRSTAVMGLEDCCARVACCSSPCSVLESSCVVVSSDFSSEPEDSTPVVVSLMLFSVTPGGSLVELDSDDLVVLELPQETDIAATETAITTAATATVTFLLRPFSFFMTIPFQHLQSSDIVIFRPVRRYSY
jgi:hypothetical protein